MVVNYIFISIILGALGSLFVIRYATQLGLVDIPNSRSSHSTPIPKGGGVGISFSFLTVSVLSGAPIILVAAGLIFSIIGLWSDFRDPSPKLRLLIQMATALICIIAVCPHEISLYHMPLLLFFTLFCVGSANIYNFMDGINGIAGTIGFVSFGLLYFYIENNNEFTYPAHIALAISFSCVGFLPFNVPKAHVFMGDVASLLIGFVFASFVVVCSESILDFICLSSFMFMFYADEIVTMAYRLKRGHKLTQAHRLHLYQILANEYGITHWKVSASYGFIQLLIGTAVLLMISFGFLSIFFLLVCCFALFYIITDHFRKNLNLS